jgi:hypothetical protein
MKNRTDDNKIDKHHAIIFYYNKTADRLHVAIHVRMPRDILAGATATTTVNALHHSPLLQLGLRHPTNAVRRKIRITCLKKRDLF